MHQNTQFIGGGRIRIRDRDVSEENEEAYRFIRDVKQYRGDEHVPSIGIATEIAGVDLDEIEKVYEINPLLYFLAIDRYTFDYVRNTIRKVNTIGAESIHRQRERGGVMAKRAV